MSFVFPFHFWAACHPEGRVNTGLQSCLEMGYLAGQLCNTYFGVLQAVEHSALLLRLIQPSPGVLVHNQPCTKTFLTQQNPPGVYLSLVAAGGGVRYHFS